LLSSPVTTNLVTETQCFVNAQDINLHPLPGAAE